jgi:hypothetical protein
MAPRVDSELLLVGSLPADSADSALCSAAGFFADLVFALPDGETGPRAAWVGYERERLGGRRGSAGWDPLGPGDGEVQEWRKMGSWDPCLTIPQQIGRGSG